MGPQNSCCTNPEKTTRTGGKVTYGIDKKKYTEGSKKKHH